MVVVVVVVREGLRVVALVTGLPDKERKEHIFISRFNQIRGKELVCIFDWQA